MAAMYSALGQVFQFKITLKHSKPPIWRRVQVPESYNFHQLHKAIQCAMGWQSADTDYHLHKFQLPGGVSIGMKPDAANGYGPEAEDSGFLFDEKITFIQNYFGPAENMFSMKVNKARYVYDFRDGWNHDILLESILPAAVATNYPLCLTGRRACPPEDSGGIHSFYDLLDILESPNHPDYPERRAWAEGQGYDVSSGHATFDPAAVNFLPCML